MKIEPFRYAILSMLLGILAAPANLAAFTCFEPSPGLIADGDRYFDLLDDVKLSTKEKKQAAKLASKLKGEWLGRSSEIECFGSDRAPLAKEIRYSVSGELLPIADHGIRISLEKENRSKGISRSEGIDVLAGLLLWEKQISSKGISTVEKFRTAAPRGARLLEFRTKLNAASNKLAIDIVHYSNGVAVAAKRFDLRRN